MKMKFNPPLFLTVLTYVISSCDGLSTPATDIPNKNACVPPITSFSYPTNGYERSMQPSQVTSLPPWVEVSPIPQSLPLDEISYNYVELQFARVIDDSIEIWMMSHWSAKVDHDSKHTIYVYRTKDKTWREVSSLIAEVPAEIFRLYLGNDGTIWASASSEIGNAHGYVPGYPKTPRVFGKFNEKEDKFELVKFLQKIPLGPVAFNQNKFWIFEENGPVYSVDPRTLGIAKYIDPRSIDVSKLGLRLPQVFVNTDDSLAFMQDGSFFIFLSR